MVIGRGGEGVGGGSWKTSGGYLVVVCVLPRLPDFSVSCGGVEGGGGKKSSALHFSPGHSVRDDGQGAATDCPPPPPPPPPSCAVCLC